MAADNLRGNKVPNYRRFYSGVYWFFTVVTHKRAPFLITSEALSGLKGATRECRERYPFEVDGWVLLADHLHCIWKLPENDLDYSRRWSIIKRKFTQQYRDMNIQPPFWQKRFWAHALTDENDYKNHMNYIHYNPVKHKVAKSPEEWRWTSLHRYQKAGLYPLNWGRFSDIEIPTDVGKE